MKRIIRDRLLTPEEAAGYAMVRAGAAFDEAVEREAQVREWYREGRVEFEDFMAAKRATAKARAAFDDAAIACYLEES